jgi:hypothetical protein
VMNTVHVSEVLGGIRSTLIALRREVVIDDNGENILVINCRDWPHRRRVFHNREVILELLRALSAGIDPLAVPLATTWEPEFAALQALGALGPIEEVSGPFEHPQAPKLAYGSFTVSVAVGRDLEGMSHALSRVMAGLRDRVHGGTLQRLVLKLRSCEEMQPGQGSQLATNVIRASKECALPLASIDYEIQLSGQGHAETRFAREFMDSVGACTCVPTLLGCQTIDANDTAVMSLLQSTQELSRCGFVCQPEIRVPIDPSIVSIVRRLNEACEGHGVRVLPAVFPQAMGAIHAPFESKAGVERALGVIDVLGCELGTSVMASEPWRSILVAAMMPTSTVHSWNIERSCLYVSQTREYARSGLHYCIHGSDDLETLLSNEGQRESLPNKRSRDGRWPACTECPLGAACVGYRTPEVDALLRSGQQEAAELLASYESGLRFRVLPLLFDAFREDFVIPSRTTSLIGRLTLEEGKLYIVNDF